MLYIRQLDSLRAVAVSLVIITHWFPESHPLNYYTSVFNGVDIFFALSGFLITSILLSLRKKADEERGNKTGILKNFYARRALRIFPIYYLVLAGLFVLGSKANPHIRDTIWYFITYTSNFYFYNRNEWDGIVSHLWSLSAEEQFYIIWPWVMLYLRRDFLAPLIILAIAVGIAGQLWLPGMSDILTFSCFDGFGLGALLAWAFAYRPHLLHKCFKPMLAVSFVCCIAQVYRVINESAPLILPSRTLTSVITITYINFFLLKPNVGEKKSNWLSFFSNPLLVRMGKISYGVYIFHLIIPYFSAKILAQVNSALFPGAGQSLFYIQIIENFCILIGVACLSWIFIEKPILKFKTKFAYLRRPASVLVQNPVASLPISTAKIEAISQPKERKDQ